MPPVHEYVRFQSPLLARRILGVSRQRHERAIEDCRAASRSSGAKTHPRKAISAAEAASHSGPIRAAADPVVYCRQPLMATAVRE
jgi:hypothetical protein